MSENEWQSIPVKRSQLSVPSWGISSVWRTWLTYLALVERIEAAIRGSGMAAHFICQQKIFGCGPQESWSSGKGDDSVVTIAFFGKIDPVVVTGINRRVVADRRNR